MTEQTLRNIISTNGYSREYALTQNQLRTRYSYNLGENDRNLSLRPKWIDGTMDEFPTREKVYFQNGDIMRTNQSKSYTAIIPKNGTGKFSISDNGINIRGEIKQGKINKLNEFYGLGAPIKFAPLRPNGNIVPSSTNAETVSTILNNGIKLQNLTNVMLKKVLQYLSK